MRTINRLTAHKVERISSPGFYPDGAGLYLQVGKGDRRSWVYRYMLHGVEHDMGIGSLREVSLAEARRRAAEFRSLRSQGIDPIEARRKYRAEAKLAADRSMTFRQCAEAYIHAHRPSWRNEKHAAQWTSSLEKYVYKEFGDHPVQSIDTPKVLKVLEAIWSDKNETATRVRGRIEAILNWASARGNRTGDNPARWRGHLENLLPKPSKVTKVKHHTALPYLDVPKFMSKLRQQNGIAALALEFLILTATRTGEILGARWSEIDLNERIWTIPVERMKAAREHRIPLSNAAMDVLERLPTVRHVDHVFPSLRLGHPLSDMALLALLRRMGRDDITVHGFRSSFRDWVSEETTFQSEVAEMALAHTIENKVEAAYRRGDLFEKRQVLMEAWARYCDGRQEKVEVAASQLALSAVAKAA